MHRHLKGILLILIVLLNLCALVHSGERRARTKAAPKEESPEDNMTIEELRTYQGYFFSTGGRDPMVMRLPTDRELGLDTKGPGRRAPTIEEQESELTKWLAQITEAIKIQDYDSALQVAGEAIQKIDNEWPAIKPEHMHLIRMTEEIRSYANMASRLKNLQDIEKEFASLGLRVNGVSWSPTDAKAVVNGVPLSAGEIMLTVRRQGDLRIENIEEHGVIFQFRGIRFRLPVQVYGRL